MNEDKLLKAMNQAKVTNEIENITIKDEHTSLVKARLKNEITEEEFQKKAKELIKRNNM